MARRRAKKRTHIGKATAHEKAPDGRSMARDPKSMVIRIGAGEVGSSVSQLVTDIRRVMEPGTAVRLKERRANRLHDYVSMCGPLGVTHLLLVSRSESGNTNLRIALAPRGPTLHFRIERYSLAKDVQKAQRHPRGGGKEYIAPPLLVMNNFTSPASEPNPKTPKHLESLTTTVFQSLFPPINPQTTPLKSIHRVLLLNREPASDEDGDFIVNFRHYAITTKSVGLSRPLRRLNAAEKLLAAKSRKGGMPNLGKLEDIADFMIGGPDGEGYMTDATSGSEVDTDAEVDVLETASRRLPQRSRAGVANGASGPSSEAQEDNATDERVERRAVKLVELGPRMRLRLTKVEDGMCSGKVMWHEYINKTKEEAQELDERWDKRRKEKEARKKEQKANVEKKKAANAAKKKAAKENGEAVEDEDEDDDQIYNASDMDWDDDLDEGDSDEDDEGMEDAE